MIFTLHNVQTCHLPRLIFLLVLPMRAPMDISWHVKVIDTSADDVGRSLTMKVSCAVTLRRNMMTRDLHVCSVIALTSTKED